MNIRFNEFPANAEANLFGVETTHDKRTPVTYTLAQKVLILGQQAQGGL